jgi:hypothetical protein
MTQQHWRECDTISTVAVWNLVSAQRVLNAGSRRRRGGLFDRAAAFVRATP